MDETFETSKRPPRFPAGLMSERGVRCGPNEWGMVIGPYGGENRTQRVDGALMVQELLVLGWGGIHPADAACEDCVSRSSRPTETSASEAWAGSTCRSEP